MTSKGYHSHNTKRQIPHQGDWICINCQNYNYSVRIICNRCHIQTKQANQLWLKEWRQQQMRNWMMLLWNEVQNNEKKKSMEQWGFPLCLETSEEVQKVQEQFSDTEEPQNIKSIISLLSQ